MTDKNRCPNCRYDRFTFDVTDALLASSNSTHEVIVRVYSPVDSAHIPLGKQRLHVPSKSIFYSAASGIWQTVWLELVSTLLPSHHLGSAASHLLLYVDWRCL